MASVLGLWIWRVLSASVTSCFDWETGYSRAASHRLQGPFGTDGGKFPATPPADVRAALQAKFGASGAGNEAGHTGVG